MSLFFVAYIGKSSMLATCNTFGTTKRKGEVEIPEFLKNHDDVLEHRPLTDYDNEPNPYTCNPHCKDGFI
jgi:hypothetical protein